MSLDFLLLKSLDLVDIDIDPFSSPCVPIKTRLHAEMAQKAVRIGKLLPYLGKKSGLTKTFLDDHTVNSRPELHRQVRCIREGKRLRFGEDADLDPDFWEFVS